MESTGGYITPEGAARAHHTHRISEVSWVLRHAADHSPKTSNGATRCLAAPSLPSWGPGAGRNESAHGSCCLGAPTVGGNQHGYITPPGVRRRDGPKMATSTPSSRVPSSGGEGKWLHDPCHPGARQCKVQCKWLHHPSHLRVPNRVPSYKVLKRTHMKGEGGLGSHRRVWGPWSP